MIKSIFKYFIYICLYYTALKVTLINSCIHKLTSALYAINRVNNFLPVSAFNTTYYTLVYRYLTYGIISWGSTYQSHFTKVFIIQKKTICSILKTNYMEHSHALSICLHLLKLMIYTNLKLEYLWIVLSMGVYHICYAICSHLPTIYTSIKPDKYHKYAFSLDLLPDPHTVCYAKVRWFGTQLQPAFSSHIA